MESIGVRELRQHASRWLARVAVGESFAVTDRGRPVAVLVPLRPGSSVLERLADSGELTPATGNVLDVEPVPVAPGAPAATEVLREMREAERW